MERRLLLCSHSGIGFVNVFALQLSNVLRVNCVVSGETFMLIPLSPWKQYQNKDQIPRKYRVFFVFFSFLFRVRKRTT
jgi:hypothetical protein